MQSQGTGTDLKTRVPSGSLDGVPINSVADRANGEGWELLLRIHPRRSGRLDGAPAAASAARGSAAEKVPGGWTVVLKSNGDTLQYASPLWTDASTVLDASSDPEAPATPVEAYNTQSFDAVMACVGSLQNCLPAHAFEEPVVNAAALFGGPHRREGVIMDDFLHVFGVQGYRECEPQRPGFNTVCSDGNHARWGFCVNIPSQNCQANDSDDADGVIGFGIEDCPMGGWSAPCALCPPLHLTAVAAGLTTSYRLGERRACRRGSSCATAASACPTAGAS